MSEDIKFMMACLMGAVVRMLRSDNTTNARRLSEALSGFAAAYYIAPVVVSSMNWTGEEALCAAFAMGLVGMELCGALMTASDEYLPGRFRDLLQRLFGVSK